MTEWQLWCTVAVAAVLARIGWPERGQVALVLVLLATVAAVLWRQPTLFVVALVFVVGWRSHSAQADLRVHTGPVDGLATVWSDGQWQSGSWQAEVRFRGRHLMASFPADAGPAPQVGERVRVRAVQSPIRHSDWQRSRHLAGRLRVESVGTREPPIAPIRAINWLRSQWWRGAGSLGSQRALFTGLVLGDDARQEPVQQERFRAAGLSHLLAVSGQNIAYLLTLLEPLQARCSLRRRWLLVGSVLVVFVLLTRGEPSVLRAGALAMVVVSAQRSGRFTTGWRRLGVAVLGLLCIDPLLIDSVGFLLSVGASGAIVLLRHPLARRLPGPPSITEPVAVVLAAQIGTTPLLLALGQPWSPVSLVANLLAVPVAGWVMMIGVPVGLLAGVAGPSVAWLVHRPIAVMVGWVDLVARWFGNGRWPVLDSVGAASALVALAVLVLVRGRWRYAAVIPVVAGVLWTAVDRPAAGTWAAGSGARVARSASGVSVLVLDGRAQVRAVVGSLRSRGVRSLAVIVVRSSSDQAGATATAVAELMPVGRVYALAGVLRNATPIRPCTLVWDDLTVRVDQTGSGGWSVKVRGVG